MINLRMILEEIDSLKRPQDMPRKIILLQHALSLVPRQLDSQLWAALEVELGYSLYQNPQENREDNIEQAIEHYNQALEAYTQRDFPVQWAMTQNDLANAYRDRIMGDKAENIEKAIEYYNQALEVRTQKDFPEDWAITQNNLGNAYSARILGDRAENIKHAIEHYNQALEVRTQKDFPVGWAMTQYNLANAYRYRILGDRAENIEKAIEHYNQALEVRTQKYFPEDWAITQNNLGNAYSDRILGDRAENIKHAIEHYNQALEVYTHNDFPVEWAGIQKNLALVYNREVSIAQAFEKISGSTNEKSTEDLLIILKEIDSFSRPEDTSKRIMMLRRALSLVRPQSNPRLWPALQTLLGNSLHQSSQGNQGDNIEQAIEHYNQALQVYKYQDFPVEWAETQNNLASAYYSRIKGDIAENIEQALEHCDQSLKVRTYQDFPREWAYTQTYLALAFRDRIRGNRAENIEKAIEHNNHALKVYTYQAFPVEWAMIQNNLALSYRYRIRGDKAENIEQAIEHNNQALKVRTYQDFPVDWALTMNNLALSYRYRIRGDKAENIEQAIEYCNQALKVQTYQYLPADWAETQNNLANAYCDRIQGDRVENIEQAIKHNNQALKVFKYQAFPEEWAQTKNNLANAYLKRIRGDKAENIKHAIEHYEQALVVRTYQDFPVDWARTQINLASAYYSRIREDIDADIEQAIEHYNQALKVYTYQEFPVDWAMIQHNLTAVYVHRIRGDKAMNIEMAIKHGNQALKVRTKEDFPVEWAMTQYNLANAYYDRLQGDRVENIEQAIDYCFSALEIYRFGSMPQYFRDTCRLLGDLYLDKDQWKDALKSYKESIKADKLLYRSVLSVENKTVAIEENTIYKNSTFAACRLDLVTEAILILEGEKTRLLSETLRLKMKQPDCVPQEEWTNYQRAAEKYRSTTKPSGYEKDYTQWEKEVQKALEELDAAVKIVQSYDPEFQKELKIPDILSIPDNETSLLTFCITDKGSIGFVVSESDGIKSVDIPDFRTRDLNSLLYQKDEHGLITGSWIVDYLNYVDVPDNKGRKDVFQAWQKTINNVLSNIGAKLLNPLLAKLPPQTKRLIILPSGGLFLLPLHAVPLSCGQLLCQRYCISYAPSIQLLRETQNKARIAKGEDLYEVINPEEDPALVFSGYEGQAISRLFPSSQISVGETGTRATVLDRIPGCAYIHFSCHGNYNWMNPPQSGLRLVGGKALSLADLQNDIVDMSSARLVTLSACETGITDIVKGSADEFVGLPAGFMLAGVACVVSSLWSVPDISTAILMERFYSNHIVGGMEIPLALQDAQLWVRDLTFRQVADYVEKCYRSSKWEGKSREFVERYREHYLKMAKESPGEKPFYHPYYWAAFTVNGA